MRAHDAAILQKLLGLRYDLCLNEGMPGNFLHAALSFTMEEKWDSMKNLWSIFALGVLP